MSNSLNINEDASDDPISRLQKEIEALEADLNRVQKDLHAFEIQIHTRLDKELARMHELYALYKKQKKEKKAKRLEQKKRGKNYVAQEQVMHAGKTHAAGLQIDPDQQKALKRLYKEVVVQVHPDKFVHSGEEERIQKANAITAQLNSIYRRGDLEELIYFYQKIIVGNITLEKGDRPEVIPDHRLRLASLTKKKEAILKHLDQLKNSYTYQVLMTYNNPLTFIDELHRQFMDRIKQLEKRTRTGRKS